MKFLTFCYIEGQTMQWPKEKKTNNDLQNTTQKTKDRAKQSPTGVNSGASEG
jgi:hypothetical protein